jgi:hypothetical protein
MNDDSGLPILDARILAALRAVNPPVEKLMTDRLSLRLEVRRTQQELEAAEYQMAELRHFREVQIPRYIAIAKVASLTAASLLLVSLVIALFFGLIEVKTTASLFASLILPLWLVDLAERKFGRWQYDINRGLYFIPMGSAQFCYIR